MNEVYAENPQVHGSCRNCGKKGPEYDERKGRKYPKRQYWMCFQKTGWFRGDDKFIGKVCKKCKAQFLRSFIENQPVNQA